MADLEEERWVLDALRSVWACRRCRCPDCRSGYENHEHYCTDGPRCVETRERLRDRRMSEAVTAGAAVELIRNLIRERDALADRVAALEAVEHG